MVIGLSLWMSLTDYVDGGGEEAGYNAEGVVNVWLRKAAAYKTANHGCTASDASEYAKLNEETARKAALSLAEYHDLCTKSTHLLVSPTPSEHVQDHHADEHVFPNLPHTGARIGRYVNAEHYRDGLFSEVFKAIDPETASQTMQPSLFALKITTPDLMVPPHDSVREARILSALEGPNVIPLIETFQQPGGHFVLAFPFMPYDLGTMLQRHQLTDTSRVNILCDLFKGLEHLHKLNFIHRDIKPSNILLASPSGPAYLADFGIAWSPRDNSSEPTHEKILDVGTTSYRPPELLFGNQAYGTKLDMWAAGCTAAQIVCLGSDTLFNAGDLGSELALIKSVFETLGTPDLDIWPDWGKMNFVKYPARPWEEILKGASPAAVDLVRNLVVYESRERFSAEQVCITTHHASPMPQEMKNTMLYPAHSDATASAVNT
nr:serine/threonine-protein kinase csk1 [Quercus suber]